jgi:protein SCO1/2
MTKVAKGILFGSIGLAFVASLVLVVAYGKGNFRPIPVLGSVVDFQLTDSGGRPYGPERLKGQVTIADFFFTSCKGICPTLTQQMGSLQRRFEGSHNFQLLSITVDPENDTIDKLASFAADKQLQLDNWAFVTGSRDDIRHLLIDQLKIGLADDPLTHSDRLVLLDTEMQIRGYYSLSDPDSLQQLRKDTARLLQ